MLPLVLYAKDEQEHSIRDAIESLAEQFQLSDEERKELLPSGQQTTFDNRVGWARTYLKKAGLIEYTRRGYFRVTPRGLSVVKKCSPAFFERLVIDLLLKMGYGGTRRDAGRAIGRSGDGGIDGVINE